MKVTGLSQLSDGPMEENVMYRWMLIHVTIKN